MKIPFCQHEEKDVEGYSRYGEGVVYCSRCGAINESGRSRDDDWDLPELMGVLFNMFADKRTELMGALFSMFADKRTEP